MKLMEVMGNRADESLSVGRLGTAIIDFNHGINDLSVKAASLPVDGNVIVYCRKVGGTLDAAAEYCADTEATLIFLSTGIDTSGIDTRNFPFIKVPNAALGVIDYLTKVETVASGDFAGWEPKIVEHHQETKVDTSGTAKKLADMLGIDYSNIESVRDFGKSQSEYGIPDASRDGYAVHSVSFRNPDTSQVSEAIEIVVRGREVYADGVFDIYRAMQADPEEFRAGEHDIVDLVKRGVVKAASLA